MKYSVVIPMYNSGDWISELVGEINDVMAKNSYDYELILVNDCSPKSDTWDKVLATCEKYHTVHAINLAYNVGQIKALLCGISHCTGDYIITMDDDFQHSPQDIPMLISKMTQSKYDCIITQYAEKKHSFIRKQGSRFINYLYYKAYSKPQNITSNSFRIMTPSLAKSICSYKTTHPQFGPILFSLTKNVGTVTIEHKDRKYGNSGYTLKKMIQETFNVLFTATELPIQLMFMLSFLCFIIFVINLIIQFMNPSNTMYNSLIASIFFVGFALLICLGSLGMYFKKIFEQLAGPASHIIKDEVVYGEKKV
jgi:glycosyltransferase involved in cell wall biosynthesis